MDFNQLKFLEYQPSDIVQLCLHNSSKYLAIARSNGSIELWESKLDTFSFLNSTPITQERSIRSLVCEGDRLFSAGLDGIITEWSFADISEIRSLRLDIPIWCMEACACGGLLAVGMENGSTKIYNTKDNIIEHKKDLQKQTGKIISIGWHPVGELLACGFDNSTIATFSILSGLCLQRVTLDDYNKHSTFVWQIKFLRDNTLITGSSMGKIQFWNGKFGTLKQEYTLHEKLSDILTIFVNDKEDTVYASGVDSKVVALKKIEIEGHPKWIHSGSVRVHTHGVKSIVGSEDNFVLTGGVDTKILMHNWKKFEDKSLVKIILPFTSHSHNSVKVARERRVVLFQMPYKLQLWSLIKHPQTNPEKVECILELQTKSNDGIIASAISNSAEYICWSNRKITKFYHLKWDGSESISEIEHLKHAPSQPFQITEFLRTSDQLICVTNFRTIYMYTLTPYKTFYQKHTDTESPIQSIVPSKCGQFFACVFSNSMINIYKASSLEIVSRLPSHHSKVTSIDFAPRDTNIVITYNNSEILVFNFINQRHTEWTNTFQDSFCQNLLKLHRIEITNLTATFFRDNKLLLSSYNGICEVKLEHIFPSESEELAPRSKKRAKITEKVSYRFHDENFSIVPEHNSILAVIQISGKEVLLVDRQWENIEKEFPPSLYRERYGT